MDKMKGTKNKRKSTKPLVCVIDIANECQIVGNNGVMDCKLSGDNLHTGFNSLQNETEDNMNHERLVGSTANTRAKVHFLQGGEEFKDINRSFDKVRPTQLGSSRSKFGLKGTLISKIEGKEESVPKIKSSPKISHRKDISGNTKLVGGQDKCKSLETKRQNIVSLSEETRKPLAETEQYKEIIIFKGKEYDTIQQAMVETADDENKDSKRFVGFKEIENKIEKIKFSNDSENLSAGIQKKAHIQQVKKTKKNYEFAEDIKETGNLSNVDDNSRRETNSIQSTNSIPTEDKNHDTNAPNYGKDTPKLVRVVKEKWATAIIPQSKPYIHNKTIHHTITKKTPINEFGNNLSEFTRLSLQESIEKYKDLESEQESFQEQRNLISSINELVTALSSIEMCSETKIAADLNEVTGKNSPQKVKGIKREKKSKKRCQVSVKDIQNGKNNDNKTDDCGRNTLKLIQETKEWINDLMPELKSCIYKDKNMDPGKTKITRVDEFEQNLKESGTYQSSILEENGKKLQDLKSEIGSYKEQRDLLSSEKEIVTAVTEAEKCCLTGIETELKGEAAMIDELNAKTIQLKKDDDIYFEFEANGDFIRAGEQDGCVSSSSKEIQNFEFNFEDEIIHVTFKNNHIIVSTRTSEYDITLVNSEKLQNDKFKKH